MSTILRLSAAMLALLCAACAPTTPQWERSFGASVRATLAAQVAKPEAVRNVNPVAGIDGRAARVAQERYESAQKSAEAAPMVGNR